MMFQIAYRVIGLGRALLCVHKFHCFHATILFAFCLTFFSGAASEPFAGDADCTEFETVAVSEVVPVEIPVRASQERQKAIRAALVRATEMVSGIEVYSNSRESVDATLNSIENSTSQRQVIRSLGRVLEWSLTDEILDTDSDGNTLLEVAIEAVVCLEENGPLPFWVAIDEIDYADDGSVPVLKSLLIDELGRSKLLRTIQGSPNDFFYDFAISVSARVRQDTVDNTQRLQIIRQFAQTLPVDDSALRYQQLTATVIVTATRFFDDFQIAEIEKRRLRLIDPNAAQQKSHELVERALQTAATRLRERLDERDFPQ